MPAGTTTESINVGQTLSFKISNSTTTPEVGGSEDPDGPDGPEVGGSEDPDGPDGPEVGGELGSGSIGTFSITKYCNLLGNVMSMVFGDDAANNISLYGYDSVFWGLFSDCDTISTVSNNFLPATELSFQCYASMFQNCTSLTTAPELPATNLYSRCYASMFQNCTSLTTAPELPATILSGGCYVTMFSGCINLSYIKAMFIELSSSTNTLYWVNNVASKGTFIKNKNATWNVVGINAIPSGWTVKTE